MKAQTYLISYQPYPTRAEHCTLGVLVFDENRRARAHLARNLKKATALDPQVTADKLRESLERLVAEVNQAETAWDAFRNGIAAFRFSKEAGFFQYATPADYDRQVEWLLQTAAEPRAKVRAEPRRPKSRLFIELKSTFKAYGWLGEKPGDIDKHKVVTNYPVSEEEDLSAEFAMRNGVLHLVETVDFRTGMPSTKRMEARGKALVFDSAKELGLSTACTVVVAAPDRTEVKGTMKMLQRYADRVAVYESTADMQSLFRDWAEAMNRPMLPLPPVS